jgi:hypothetical protein
MKWLEFLYASEHLFRNCIGFEVIFALFLKDITTTVIDGKVGLNGYVSVTGDYIDT